VSRLYPGPTQPPVQWVPASLSPKLKRLRRVADHSSLSSAVIKNGGRYWSISLKCNTSLYKTFIKRLSTLNHQWFDKPIFSSWDFKIVVWWKLLFFRYRSTSVSVCDPVYELVHPIVMGKLFLCLTNYALRHEGVLGSGCFLDIGTSWRCVISFTPRRFSPRRKSPRYPLDMRLGGPQGRYGRYSKVKILAGTETRTPNPRSFSLKPAAIPTDYAIVGLGVSHSERWPHLSKHVVGPNVDKLLKGSNFECYRGKCCV
jgi:hypothetical protein